MSVVQLADMKAQLNLTTTDDDVLVQALIDAAESYISRFSEQGLNDPAILQAIKLLASHLYENREATLVGVTAAQLPLGLFDLLTPFREWAF